MIPPVSIQCDLSVIQPMASPYNGPCDGPEERAPAGVLHVFSIKKGSIETAFKSLPTGQPISSVTHGLGELQKDKIFISFARTIQVRSSSPSLHPPPPRPSPCSAAAAHQPANAASVSGRLQGVTKKGKEFYRFATGLGEDIRKLAVKDLTLVTTGRIGQGRIN